MPADSGRRLPPHDHTRSSFLLYLLKPSHYDDEGYVLQWVRSDVPSNTLATLNAIAIDCNDRRVLGEDVDIIVNSSDETNTRIHPDRIIRAIQGNDGQGLVALVGVQSNQFPRAMDIARPMRAAGINVCVGGFHVSGCLAMLPEVPADIQEAIDLGISIFLGEAEGRLDEVLLDAQRGELAPRYDYLSDLPGLEGTVTPILPRAAVAKNVGSRATFDAGRGCPFECSFCTIINVQGRKSRFRTADDIDKILTDNRKLGITKFFITDDNFARNKNWEEIFDCIIEFQKRHDTNVRLLIQVDTLCHKIPNFIDKAGRAGVNRVFIGLENINPDNLASSKKRQNRVTEYRTMLQAWKSIGVLTYCGYIIGFPNDTPERLMRDIRIIQEELPLDLIEFFCLTPLPGSEDHQKLYEQGVWMNPDMNIYDIEHVCTAHPLMEPEEFQSLYHQAWDAFYTPDHVERIMRRAVASGGSSKKILKFVLAFYGCQAIEGVHPLQGGLFRRRYRRERRPGLRIEGRVLFYSRYAWQILSKHLRYGLLALGYLRARRRVEKDPIKFEYTDLALQPATDEDMDEFGLFNATESGQVAVARVRAAQARREKTRGNLIASSST
jgi:hypothetical protein